MWQQRQQLVLRLEQQLELRQQQVLQLEQQRLVLELQELRLLLFCRKRTKQLQR